MHFAKIRDIIPKNHSNLPTRVDKRPLFRFVLTQGILPAGTVDTMSKSETYVKRVEEFLAPIIEENDFDLVDVEYVKEAGNWYLRAYIDKPGGFTIDDCEMVSKILSDWLDKNDFIDDSYILEVSSPGLGRPLKKDKDFARSIGEQVEIKLYRPVEKQKEFSGELAAWDSDTVTIRDDNGTETVFDRKDIALIRLAFDF